MTDHIVIHGEHSGDWCLIFGHPREAGTVRPILFRPHDWSAPYKSLGLRYYPGSAITLSRNPRRAYRQARRIVAKVEREHRRRIRLVTRQRASIAQIKETP